MSTATHRGRCPKCDLRATLVVRFIYASTVGRERLLRAVELRCESCGFAKTMDAIELPDKHLPGN